MRKNILALSIAAMVGGLGVAHAGVSLEGTGAVGAAFNATNVNTAADLMNDTTATTLLPTADGVGHILMVPYFSTQNGNATLLSIVNTDTVNGKAVKVRFRGAANSDDIFDFTLLLSPGDVWTASVSQGAGGVSTLATNDVSCTLPAVNGQNFITSRLNPTLTGDALAAGTREGYVEIFNMADIPPTYIDDVARGTPATKTNALYTAIKHVNGVAPCTGAAITGTTSAQGLLVDPADEADAVAKGFNTPTTGLTGSWTIINALGASVAWSANAEALVAGGAANARGRVVFSPQTADLLVAAEANTLTNDPLLRFPLAGDSFVAGAKYDLPDLSTPYVGAGAITAASPSAAANTLSGALAVTGVINEYLTTAAISAQTDWSFSFPTRRYAVAYNYAGTTNALRRVFATDVLDAAGPATSAAASPYFTAANVSVGTGAEAGLLCVAPGVANAIASVDREERTPAGAGFVISPGVPTSLTFCGEASVLSYNAGGAGAASVLGATVARKDVTLSYNEGWARIATPGLANAGLPILGHSFVKATGPLAADKSTNFSITNEHRVTRP